MTRDEELAAEAAFARDIGIVRCPNARDIAGDRVPDVEYYLTRRQTGTPWRKANRSYRPPFAAERIKDS